MYTNVFQHKNTLLVRGVDNGRRVSTKVDFRPTLWVSGDVTHKSDKWRTLEGQAVYTIQPGSMYDCRAFVDRYKDTDGFRVYESPGHVYQYIAETHPGEVRFDPHDVVVYTIDIETETEGGFPDPSTADEQILLITVKDTRRNAIATFGLKPYQNYRDDVNYRQFTSEQALLKEFVAWWQDDCPDIVTGWNITMFDIPYLYNRIRKVVGDATANKLSPWGIVRPREIEFGTRTLTVYDIAGVADLDYLDLYKKFTYSAQESYKLDYIALVELGQQKVENPGSTFKDFYTDHWNTFVQYNIRDVELVDKLDDKMKLIDLAMTIAYAAKVNFEDVFSPVKTWDIIIYNYLNSNKTVVPPRSKNEKAGAYEGAYVKDPLIGRHNWCCSFDLNSLYPHLIMQYNMSPETISETFVNVSVDKLLDKSIDLTKAYDNDLAVAANGWCFKRDKRGLMPTLAYHYYQQRVVSKKQMIEEKKDLEKIKAELAKRGITQ